VTKTVRIETGDEKQGARGFIEAWHRGESRVVPGASVELLVFEDLETLLRTLTPGRWRLLKVLRAAGPSSVRAIAKATARDYKSVHTDVRILESVGLVERTDDNRVVVPWDAITAELRLAA
jgi:predicted transcriptional regulator